MREELQKLAEEAREKIAGTSSTAEINQVRIDLFGKKGVITQLSRRLKEIPPEERPLFGKLVNDLRQELTVVLEEREGAIFRQEKEARLQEERIDVELPGRKPRRGRPHPLLMLIDEITSIFLGMGFDVAEGPEIEWDYYNFEALNIPPEHPAREMHDSLYITEKILLRTHTSPVQIRTMEKLRPEPVRIIAPGRVYRRDALDATHSPLFYQIEGLAVDEGITFGNLKGILTVFARKIFGSDREVRFRPSFFPFTEPSAEVDVSCGCQAQAAGSAKTPAGWRFLAPAPWTRGSWPWLVMIRRNIRGLPLDGRGADRHATLWDPGYSLLL